MEEQSNKASSKGTVGRPTETVNLQLQLDAGHAQSTGI